MGYTVNGHMIDIPDIRLSCAAKVPIRVSRYESYSETKMATLCITENTFKGQFHAALKFRLIFKHDLFCITVYGE